jgi:hypothetical protein
MGEVEGKKGYSHHPPVLYISSVLVVEVNFFKNLTQFFFIKFSFISLPCLYVRCSSKVSKMLDMEFFPAEFNFLIN